MDVHKAVFGSAREQVEGRQIFTLDRAERSLPLVRRIVQDVVVHYRQLLQVQNEYQAALSVGPSDTLEAVRDRRLQLTDRLNELTEELRAIGCELKNYEQGLVDFPAVLDGREVYFCWRLGEATIEHWHEVYAGFSGRQRLPKP